MRLPGSIWGSSSHAINLMDLPKELVANIVRHLPYVTLPAFRNTCKLARELVDAASSGWVSNRMHSNTYGGGGGGHNRTMNLIAISA